MGLTRGKQGGEEEGVGHGYTIPPLTEMTCPVM